MRGLLGNEELLVRVLKDFHASSVLLCWRDVWRVDSREDWCSWVRVSGDWDWGLGLGSDWGWGLFRVKIEGWRKE